MAQSAGAPGCMDGEVALTIALNFYLSSPSGEVPLAHDFCTRVQRHHPMQDDRPLNYALSAWDVSPSSGRRLSVA
jgi:hypothetical protein